MSIRVEGLTDGMYPFEPYKVYVLSTPYDAFGADRALMDAFRDSEPMARQDIYHQTVKIALQKDGWTITHDPFRLRVGKKRLAMDLGAERLISAEKGTRKIVVEVKSFVGRSDVKDLEQALGQYVLYQQVLEEQEIDRELYLAVPIRTYKSVFQNELGRILLKNELVRLVVFEEEQEVIVEWVPN